MEDAVWADRDRSRGQWEGKSVIISPAWIPSHKQSLLNPFSQSTYCSNVVKHCQEVKRTVHVVNLDPAAEHFAYHAEVGGYSVTLYTALVPFRDTMFLCASPSCLFSLSASMCFPFPWLLIQSFFLSSPPSDIRDLVQVEDVMEDENLKLGPNGGLVFCLE